jgi:hypothetical protein
MQSTAKIAKIHWSCPPPKGDPVTTEPLDADPLTKLIQETGKLAALLYEAGFSFATSAQALANSLDVLDATSTELFSAHPPCVLCDYREYVPSEPALLHQALCREVQCLMSALRAAGNGTTGMEGFVAYRLEGIQTVTQAALHPSTPAIHQPLPA